MAVAGYDGNHPALELVNSERWFGRGPGRDDVLAEPGWLEGFLRRWALGDVAAARARDLDALRSLRATLRRAHTEAAAGRPVGAAEASALDAYVAAAPVRRRFAVGERGAELTLEPVKRDWQWVAAAVAASYAELLARGDLDRMKLCENPECRCAFYDESKNRSRRWCYPEVCGNLDKVRRFRERQRRARAAG